MEEIEEWLLRMGRVFPQDPEMFGYRAIGQRPVAAFGNSDGDQQMLDNGCCP
jgi:hypothetical protein